MQTYFEGDQVSLFDQDTSAGKNVMGVFSSGTPHGEDFRIVLEEIVRLHRPDYQFLDLSSDAGNLLGQFEWEMRSALHGGCWLRNSGASPRDATESCLVADLGGSSAEKSII